jgi:hypothetical protein
MSVVQNMRLCFLLQARFTPLEFRKHANHDGEKKKLQRIWFAATLQGSIVPSRNNGWAKFSISMVVRIKSIVDLEELKWVSGSHVCRDKITNPPAVKETNSSSFTEMMNTHY